MKKILDVKTWLLKKNPQFKIISTKPVFTEAVRLKDGEIFSNGGIESFITYNGQRGMILEFMANYVHVQIEVRKPGAPDYVGIEFDSENYEVIEVPINDVVKKNVFVSPGVYIVENDMSSPEIITGDLPYESWQQ